MQAMVANEVDPDQRPVLMFSAPVPVVEQTCREHLIGGFRPPWISYRTRAQLAAMLTFPHYIDTFRTFQDAADPNGHVDIVHPSATGAATIGRISVGGFLNSLNVCATSAGTERSVAQLYCRTTAGACQSTICTTLADCAAGQLCERRPCNAAVDCPNANDQCNLESGAL